MIASASVLALPAKSIGDQCILSEMIHTSASTDLQNKWDGKPRQGKVLVCQPAGTSKPYLQFQTSGQVVATAHAQAPLKQVSTACFAPHIAELAFAYSSVWPNWQNSEDSYCVIWKCMVLCPQGFCTTPLLVALDGREHSRPERSNFVAVLLWLMSNVQPVFCVCSAQNLGS